MCAKCGVRHSVPTGKKCAQLVEGENIIPNSQEGAVTNSLQVPLSGGPKAVVAGHLTPAVDEWIDEVEKSVTQMKNIMTQVLRAVGVKDTEQELNDSPVEMSTDDGFVQVRSRKKKPSKQSQRKHRRSQARSTSDSSAMSASEEDEGKTK